MRKTIMSDKRQCDHGGMATVRKPRVVLVGGAGSAAARLRFQQLGWDALHLPAGSDLVPAVLARRPLAVLLPIDTGWESGYLLAFKLKKARPRLRVALVAPTREPGAERFARFVGATLLAETDPPARWVSAVAG